MNFQNAYITTAGQQFLTRAVTGTKIHWDKCGCYTQNLNSATQEQINALTDLTGLVALGSASAVFDGEEGAAGLARITCQVDNSQPGCTAGSAYSFGIWARLENARGAIDITPTLIAVARVGTNAPTYFPTYTDATTRLLGVIDLAITVQSGAASTISVTTSGFALASNLQTEIDAREALENRVVTTHSATSAADGDEQTILGTKTFAHFTEFEEGIFATTAKLEYLQKANPNLNGITLTDTIIPHSGVNLGTTNNRFNGINTEYINVRTVNTGALSTNELFTGTIEGSIENISTKSNIIPYSDKEYNIGNEDFMFKEGWFRDIYANQLTIYTRITCDSYLPLNTSGSSIGSSTSKFDNAYIKDIHTSDLFVEQQAYFLNGFQVEGQILCNSDPVTIDGNIAIKGGLGLTGNISAEGEIYSEDNIQAEGDIIAGGVLQAASISNTILPGVSGSTATTPISNINKGGIVMLFVKSAYTSEKIIKPGDELTATSSTYQFGFAEFVFSQIDAQTGAGTVTCAPYNGGYTGSIKFKALTACKIPASGSGIVLAMRIQ